MAQYDWIWHPARWNVFRFSLSASGSADSEEIEEIILSKRIQERLGLSAGAIDINAVANDSGVFIAAFQHICNFDPMLVSVWQKPVQPKMNQTSNNNPNKLELKVFTGDTILHFFTGDTISACPRVGVKSNAVIFLHVMMRSSKACIYSCLYPCIHIALCILCHLIHSDYFHSYK